MTEYAIWRLTAADAEPAGHLLTRAFIDEPLFVAALPDCGQRARLCPPLFTANIRYAVHYGEAWAAGTTRGEMLGVLYWLAMPEATLTPEVSRSFGFEVITADWGGALETIVAVENQGIAAIPNLPAHWRYLQMVGVEPACQGRGVGSALLRHVVADAAGLPLCLVTDRSQNVPLYNRTGFVLVAQGTTADGAVPWWSFRTPEML
jgi:GNAT superfamily N-acetyltransferase